MKKVIGYILSIVGIMLMVVGFGVAPLNIGFLEKIGANYINGVGIALVIIGVIVSLNGKKTVKHTGEEVPIYEGTGKKRKIVGYRKD